MTACCLKLFPARYTIGRAKSASVLFGRKTANMAPFCILRRNRKTENQMKKCRYEEIGYYGKPINTISREEALKALVELTQMYIEQQTQYLETLSQLEFLQAMYAEAQRIAGAPENSGSSKQNPRQLSL